jgi:hypothetical protein
MPADVRLTKPELRLLFRLAQREYVQRTERSEALRASVSRKIGEVLSIPPRAFVPQPPLASPAPPRAHTETPE